MHVARIGGIAKVFFFLPLVFFQIIDEFSGSRPSTHQNKNFPSGYLGEVKKIQIGLSAHQDDLLFSVEN